MFFVLENFKGRAGTHFFERGKKMKQLLFVCVFAAIVLCLVTCNRDMSVEPVVEQPVDQGTGFYILHPSLEFSNYCLTGEIILNYYGTEHIQWHVENVPDWLVVTPKSGVLLYGETPLVITADTTKTIPMDERNEFKIIIKNSTARISCWFFDLPTLPQHIITAGNQFVISRVGSDFFNNYTILNKHKTRFHLPYEICIKKPESCVAYMQNPFYHMVYNITALNIPENNGLIQFILDTLGTVVSTDNQIPDCITNPCECEFPISEAQALEIARNAGLEEGIKPWETQFSWYYDEEVQSYVWSVKNTLEGDENGSPGLCGSGNKMIIDANSGVVIAVHNWVIMS